MFQVGLKKFPWSKKLKILCSGHMLLVILTEKKYLERFTKENCKKRNQKKNRFERVKKKKEKTTNYMLNRKTTIVLLIVWLIKKDIII